jgi:multiple sugar transport system substrate-binding protein
MFLKWFTESERNIEFSVGSGYLPVKKDANDMEKINSIVENLENKPSDLLMSSISTAINNSKNSVLYSMKPFENAEAARDFAGSFIQDTADEAYNEIMERIEKGENREDILSEYTDEKAFEEWYNEFISEFSEI